jgi:hypothetical protein
MQRLRTWDRSRKIASRKLRNAAGEQKLLSMRALKKLIGELQSNGCLWVMKGAEWVSDSHEPRALGER